MQVKTEKLDNETAWYTCFLRWWPLCKRCICTLIRVSWRISNLDWLFLYFVQKCILSNKSLVKFKFKFTHLHPNPNLSLVFLIRFSAHHDDGIKWKHFPYYWPFVRGIHWSSVNSPHKGQWRGVLMFSLICAWINGWVNNGEAGDLRRHRAHYDVIVMFMTIRWTVYIPNVVDMQPAKPT